MGLYVYATLELLFTSYIPGSSYDLGLQYNEVPSLVSLYGKNVDEDRL